MILFRASQARWLLLGRLSRAVRAQQLQETACSDLPGTPGDPPPRPPGEGVAKGGVNLVATCHQAQVTDQELFGLRGISYMSLEAGQGSVTATLTLSNGLRASLLQMWVTSRPQTVC